MDSSIRSVCQWSLFGQDLSTVHDIIYIFLFVEVYTLIYISVTGHAYLLLAGTVMLTLRIVLFPSDF
jgi:hypothetical protein